MDVLLHFRFSEIYMNINFHILIFSAVHISTPANSEFVFFCKYGFAVLDKHEEYVPL